MKKVLMFLLLGMFMISLVSADWTERVVYSNNDLKVDIKSYWGFFEWLGINSTIGSFELKSHKSVDEVLKVGSGQQVTMYYDFDFTEDYNDGLGNVKFINMKNGVEVYRNYKFVYWVTEKKTKQVCSEYSNSTLKNGTIINSCSKYSEQSYDSNSWKDYDSNKISKGKIRIGIMVENKLGDYIDGVWEIGGKEITKHASWNTTLETSLTSWYKLDETTGVTAYDSVGTYNGTNNGATINQTGKIGQAYDFEASDVNDSINLNGVVLSTDVNAEFTVCAWLKPESKPTDSAWFQQNAGGAGRLSLGMTSAGYPYTFLGGVKPTSSTDIQDGDWHFICSKRDDSNISVWVDGSVKASLAKTDALDNTNSKISGTAGVAWDGLIDEVGVWNRALSSSEILNLYNGGYACTYKSCINLGIITLLYSPPNETKSNNANNTFVINISNPLSLTISNVSLVIDDVVVQTNTSGSEGLYNFTRTLTDGDYVWRAISYDNDSNIYYSTENRTISIDTTEPVITLNYPTSIINYGIFNSSLQLNFTTNDTNLDKVWYNYNGTNITIAGAVSGSYNISNITLSTKKNVTIYANDTTGNLKAQTFSWDYIAFLNSLTYNATSYATTNEVFVYNVTMRTGHLLYNAEIYYNSSTGRTSTITGSNPYIVRNSFNILYSGSNWFYLKLYYSNSSGSYTLNTNNNTQVVAGLPVITINSTACGAGFFAPYVYQFYSEINRTAYNASLVKYNFKYGIDNLTSYWVNGSYTNIASLRICINQTIDSYKLGYGEIEYQRTGHATRRYYMFEQDSLSNSTTSNIKLFSLPDSKSTSFLMEFRTPTLVPYTNKYTTLLRWYPEINEYKIVEMGKTDDKGQIVKKIEIEDVDYRVGIYYLNGSLIYLASPLRMVCLTSPCSYTLTVRDTETNAFTEVSNIETSLTYSSGVFTLIYNDVSQNTDMIELVVQKLSGSSVSEICSANSTDWTGVLTCNVSSYTGTLKAIVYRTASPQRTITSLIIDTATNVFQGTFGLFLTTLITITLIFLGVISPVVSIMLGMVSLIPAFLIFKTITYPIFIGFAIVSILVIHFMRSANKQ